MLALSGVSSGKDGVPGQLRFQALARLKVAGGSVSGTNQTIRVTGANAVTIYVSIATNYVSYKDISADAASRATAYLAKAFPKTYAKLEKTHVAWCKAARVDYVPLVFPGFSWGNLKNSPSVYNQNPRLKGDFLWQQVAGARAAGAQSLYVAMFDEVDEGTAIFKTRKENQLPLNGEGKFVGIESDLDSDYYLWLTGQATHWFQGQKGYSAQKPVRKK